MEQVGKNFIRLQYQQLLQEVLQVQVMKLFKPMISVPWPAFSDEESAVREGVVGHLPPTFIERSYRIFFPDTNYS